MDSFGRSSPVTRKLKTASPIYAPVRVPPMMRSKAAHHAASPSRIMMMATGELIMQQHPAITAAWFHRSFIFVGMRSRKSFLFVKGGNLPSVATSFCR